MNEELEYFILCDKARGFMINLYKPDSQIARVVHKLIS